MSYKHPSVQQVLNCSVSLTNNQRVRRYLSNSSLNLAKYKFYALFKRNATLDDSQTLYNIYEVQWERIHTKKNQLERQKSVHKWAKTYL